MYRLWFNCHIATMTNGNYNLISQGALITASENIVWLGQHHQLPDYPLAQRIDLQGAIITPGLIDCHTHTVFAGNRSEEFALRLQGVSYSDIARSGGGIASTVNATCKASESVLLDDALNRIQALRQDGVTTLEIKSGYGLDLHNERKILRVIGQLREKLPLNIHRTCLAAHALPPAYHQRPDDYINWICDQLLPRLHAEQLIDAVDAFCEHLAFSVSQVEKVFQTAQSLGLPIKIHADQLSSIGASRLAARYGALSADHLEYLSEADIQLMAKAGTVAVLLPGAFYFLRETQKPPIALLRKYRIPMAVSSDLNPGTSPTLSLRLMLNMACTLFGLTAEEALAGVTIHAAQALGIASQSGSLSAGKEASFVAWRIQHPAELAYWLGGSLSKRVIFKGREIYRD